MKIVRSVTTLLLILLGIATLIVLGISNTAPPYPDIANVYSAKNYLDSWYAGNMPTAEYHVREAYSAVSGLASDYRNSIVSTGDVAFSSLTSAVQEKMVGMFMSIGNQSYALAKNMAKTHTLQSATESGISHHTQRLYNYNELWDKHGTVYKEAVYAAIRTEIQNTGQFVIDADSYIEAYCAYEFCVGEYNQQVENWNNYAPSQKVNKITATSHSKAEFDKVSCFGDCNYQHDTFNMARDAHLAYCGYTLDDGPRSTCNTPFYQCAFNKTCRLVRLHFRSNPPNTSPEYPLVAPPDDIVVPDATTCTACGVSYTASEASDHEWVYESCPSSHAHYECDGTDHSLQASCSSTDSNGNSCTVTNFYACDSHTHSYPSPPPTPPTPPTTTPPPTPPTTTPTTVACGGAAWTGCSGASSRTEHKVPSCSHCNNSYWTCSQWAYRHTTQKTCRRPGCGVTYYQCQNGTCTSTWGTHASHWAQ